LLIGLHKKATYYTLEKSKDASKPYALKHFQAFPIFTTDDMPYVVILGQHNGQEPLARISHRTCQTRAGGAGK
jgi:hypothetical protein